MRKPNRPQPPPAPTYKTANRPPIQQKRTTPVAPPAYRPQPTPKVLQPKAATPQPPTPGRVNAAHSPPPVYRPQPQPKVLQRKAARIQQPDSVTERAPTAPRAVNAARLKAPTVGTVQPGLARPVRQLTSALRTPPATRPNTAQARGTRGGSIQPMFNGLGCSDQENTAPQTFTFSWNGSFAQLLNSQGTPICWFDASVEGEYRASAMYTNYFQTLSGEEGKGYQTLLMHLIAKIAQKQGLKYIEIHSATFGTNMDEAAIKWGFVPDPEGVGGDRVSDTNAVLKNTEAGVLGRRFDVPPVVTGNKDTITKK